jgi:hypothetical protein
MGTYNVYVGSDNTTGELDIQRITGVLLQMHDGWTIHRATGSWRGTVESSVIVTIQDETDKVIETVKLLKRELSQEAVGYQPVADIQYV